MNKVQTILIDGRVVQAEECVDLGAALCGPTDADRPELYEFRGRWYVNCQCCDSSNGEHAWNPRGHALDPDGGHYGCGPCCGTGSFAIQMP